MGNNLNSPKALDETCLVKYESKFSLITLSNSDKFLIYKNKFYFTTNEGQIRFFFLNENLR